MKIGVNILNFGPGANPKNLAEWAKRAEDMGFHFAMISDHVAVTPDVQRIYPAPFYDPFILLSWMAGMTRTIELGTTVTILPYRHPLLTARVAANIDRVSGGRFILGVGVGWAREEFEALGVPFERRGAIANEYLEVIRKCWESEVATHSGKFLSFGQVHTGPLPSRRPSIPIWVGGSSEGALRRAARYGDGWHPIQVRIDWLKNKGLPRLREIAEREGHSVPSLCPRIRLELTKEPLEEERRLAGRGSFDQVRADLEELAALGAEYVLLDTYAGEPESTGNPETHWNALEIFSKQIFDLERQALR